MKVFVIAWNRLTMLRNLCEFLADTGNEVIIMDNCSSYVPLQKWYFNCPYQVIRMGQNWGHQVYWLSGLHTRYDDKFIAVTDHDLDLNGIPKDYIEVLQAALEKNKSVIKAGLSLRIDDLPDNPYTREVVNWEKKFWETPKDVSGFYISDIDSTMAVYDSERDFGKLPNNRFFSAIRSPEPYTAKHVPWYLTKEDIENDPEEKWYSEHSHTYWNQKLKELL